MIFKKIGVLVVVFLAVFVGSAVIMPMSRVYASVPSGCKSGFLGFPSWYEYLEIGKKEKVDKNGKVTSRDTCAIIGPKEPGTDDFSFQKALPRIGLAITEILLRVAGMVAIGYVIFGGFKYMTSQGEPDGIKQAQGTVINALIGLAVAVLAVTIVSFVGGALW